MSEARIGWPYRLMTLEEWEALDRDGGRRYECVEGVLVMAPSPASRHQKIVHKLESALETQLPTNLTPVHDLEVWLNVNPLTVRIPDLVVTDTGIFETDPPHLEPGQVRLVAEVVSPGSGRTDRVTKMSEYAEAGIAEYWILDGEPLSLSAYAHDAGTYRLTGRYTGRCSLTACGVPVAPDLDALPRR